MKYHNGDQSRRWIVINQRHGDMISQVIWEQYSYIVSCSQMLALLQTVQTRVQIYFLKTFLKSILYLKLSRFKWISKLEQVKMSFNSQQEPRNYSRSFDDNQNQSKADTSPQYESSLEGGRQYAEELTLSRTYQQNQLTKKLSRSFSKKSQQSLLQRTSKTNTYVKQQHGKINQDVQDLHNLQQEIQRLQTIKSQYKNQKQSIEKLGQVVQKLKNENQQLKKYNTEKKAEQNIPERKNQDQQIQTVDQSNTNVKQERHPQQPVKRIVFDTNQKSIGKFIEQSQRSLSKNKHSSNFPNQRSPNYNKIPNNNYNLTNYYPSPQYQFDQYEFYNGPNDHIVKSHVSNKQSIIANFVEELKSQLQQNQTRLQQQKRAHRDTKEKLQGCVQELKMLHQRLQGERGVESVQRECGRLKGQLESEISGRLLLEQRMRHIQLVELERESRRRQLYGQFDRELDLMDEIYFNLQATLKL